ncbi:uncharacterized protein LY89DRAFT_736305 [Mollisia scopiformis]|uniref:CCHC-type domain-containing protein n=1 Tax=Mollisia scopiformis TaxID=149040 RepID=A0A194X228_MOLSC|nr:uncharacterized protein LY89DRAFT_736305 [Mollisia scopiformis]KUJ14260.1 hypothetical protein LY89DRAFT_736305 [Mollisia scopiformis]
MASSSWTLKANVLHTALTAHIEYQDKKGYSWYHEEAHIGWRKFLEVKEGVTWRDILRHVNRPKKQALQKLVRHPSESGWALPQDHDRHFMKLPQEVRDIIFGYCVSVEDPRTVQPLPVTSNWKTCWMSPRCDISWWEILPLAFFKRRDSKGTYTELRPIYRAKIDATCLRVNKKFFKDGNHLLYSNNTLEFLMVNEHYQASPPSTYDGETLHRPNPSKPNVSELPDGYNNTIFATAISAIRNHIPEQELDGSVYYDHFLRFIYSIGPKNAASIKTLQFGGCPNIHECHDGVDCYKKCRQDLLNSLRFYIPFINEFCPGLRKLILRVEDDSRYGHGYGRMITTYGPSTSEEAMRPFVENELKAIRNISELVVMNRGVKLEWAEDTMKWFADRAEERKRLEWTEEKKRKEANAVRAANIICGFCGECHVWAECTNLCSICGKFGHFCKKCPHLEEFGGIVGR